MLKIRLSRAAERDLESIWFYTITEWGEAQAEKYVALIERGFSQLLDNPYLGKERPDIQAGYRVLYVEKHLIFYQVNESYIEVFGIPHMRMDVTLHDFKS
jgi:toxin ParE1/3/4